MRRGCSVAVVAVASFCGLASVCCDPAHALPPRTSQDAARPVENFERALMTIMREARTHPRRARFAIVSTAVRRDFDLDTMCEISAGAYWGAMTPQQRTTLVREFGNYLAARYVDRFDSFQGERVSLTGRVAELDGDVEVHTRIEIPRAGIDHRPVLRAAFLVRASDAGWRIEDVKWGAVSGLQVWRSAFEDVLQRGGVEALIARLDRQTSLTLRRQDRSAPPAGMPDTSHFWDG